MRKKKQELEEKGFIFDLYHYLWSDEDQNQNKVSPPNVNIPDTIFYKYGEPRLWFFTDKYGQVKKKMKSKLAIEKIEEDFLDKKPPCDIVAFFIWTNQGVQNYKFEFFNPEAFGRNLTKAMRKRDIYNDLYKQRASTTTIWSPTVCFHEKYQNQQQINDTSLDIYQRVINIETSKNQCEISQLKGKCLPVMIGEMSERIASHLEKVSVTKKNIRQMELIYKLDQNDKLYLLFCQNIISERVRHLFTFDVEDQNQDFCYSIPNYINSDKIQLPRPLNLKKSNQCMNCEKLLDEESVYEIDLDTIIQAWDFDHIAEDQYLAEYEIDKNEKLLKKQKELKQLNPLEKRKDATFNFYSYLFPLHQKQITKNYQVPNVLRRVFPNLEYEDLLDNRDSAVFQVQKITVCEECYLKVMDSAHFGQNLKNLAKYIIKSSVHKTDDLVPLKNDRIFFHKFKSKALENERQQLSILKKDGNNSLISKKDYSAVKRDRVIDNNSRSKSSSMIFSTSFVSKNDSTLINKQFNYLKLPQLDSSKTYKPLKLKSSASQRVDTESKTLGILQSNESQNQEILFESSPKENQNESQQPQNLSNEVPAKADFQSYPKDIKKRELLRKTLTNGIDSYQISKQQYTKLAKFYPSELQQLNYKQGKNETSTSKQNINMSKQTNQSLNPLKQRQNDNSKSNNNNNKNNNVQLNNSQGEQIV